MGEGVPDISLEFSLNSIGSRFQAFDNYLTIARVIYSFSCLPKICLFLFFILYRYRDIYGNPASSPRGAWLKSPPGMGPIPLFPPLSDQTTAPLYKPFCSGNLWPLAKAITFLGSQSPLSPFNTEVWSPVPYLDETGMKASRESRTPTTQGSARQKYNPVDSRKVLRHNHEMGGKRNLFIMHVYIYVITQPSSNNNLLIINNL